MSFRARQVVRKSANRRPYQAQGLRMATQPWRIDWVFAPVERILHRIEMDGTVDAAQGKPVFYEDGNGGWYEVVAALRGIIQFHEVAAERLGMTADVAGFTRLANKLDLGSPLFDNDLVQARKCIDACRQQALRLTIAEAKDILTTVRISAALEEAA